MEPNIVQHIRQYVPLSDKEAETLLSFLRPLALRKKEHLFTEGHICTAQYFIVKGCMRLYFVDDKGTEHITQFAIENWWVADNTSLLLQKPTPFYLQAIEACEVLCLDAGRQEALLKAIPQLETYFRTVYQRAYAALQMHLKYQHDFSREEQYLHFSGLFPGFVQRIPQYMLASYLGFTPEYLSELRRKKR